MNNWVALIAILVSSWVSYQVGWREGYDTGLAPWILTHTAINEEATRQ